MVRWVSLINYALLLLGDRGHDSLIHQWQENKSWLYQFPKQITDLLCLPILSHFQSCVDCQQRVIHDFQVLNLWKRVSLSSLGRKGSVKRTLQLVFASALSCCSGPSDSVSLLTLQGLFSLEQLRSCLVWALISACGRNGLDWLIWSMLHCLILKMILETWLSAVWSLFRDTDILDTDDLEESERADIGGRCGGRGIKAGSTLGTRGNLLVGCGSLNRMGKV